jgi:hypothetical protein
VEVTGGEDAEFSPGYSIECDFLVSGNGVRERTSASKVVFGDGKKETRIGRVKEETMVSNAGMLMGTVSFAALGAACVWRGRLPKRLRFGY